MSLAATLRVLNRGMVLFDLVLGSAAVAAPAATLRALGHDEPSPDALWLFRRSGPVWLTFAVAHAVADRRGASADWQSLAWLRGSEIATDAIWSASPAFSRPGARTAMRLASASNLAMAVGFGWMAARR